jgi:hypothetical protein
MFSFKRFEKEYMFYKISLLASGNCKRQVFKDSKKRQDKRKGL